EREEGCGGVERLGWVVVADGADGAPNHTFDIDVGGGSDLARDNDVVRLAEDLARDPAVAVRLQEGVEDRVGDGVAYLFRGALRHRLRREQPSDAAALGPPQAPSSVLRLSDSPSSRAAAPSRPTTTAFCLNSAPISSASVSSMSSTSRLGSRGCPPSPMPSPR